MPRRALIWLGGCGVLTGAAWFWLRPAPITLDLAGPAGVFGLALPGVAARTATGDVLLEALVRHAPEKGRQEMQADLEAARKAAGRVDFAFAPGRQSTRSAGPGENAQRPGLVLPSEAVLQSKGVDDCFLLIRFEPASGLLETPARRRWMGAALSDAAREARSATVAVGEEGPPTRLVATVALDFGDGAKAEAALKRLVAEDASSSAIGFTATPSAAANSRVSGLVVIRLEADARFVKAALSR